jgi:hypothetical protein
MLWGLVARSVIQDRLTEAALGLRPSIRSEPVEPFEKQLIGRENEFSDGLEDLGLTTREMMILHSMHIKILQEFLLASDASLARHLTRTVIAALKDRARVLQSRQSVAISMESI